MHQYFLLALTCHIALSPLLTELMVEAGSIVPSVRVNLQAAEHAFSSGCVTRVKLAARCLLLLFFWLSDGDCRLTTNSYLCMSPSAPYPPSSIFSLNAIMSTSLRHRERERDCFLLERSMLLVLNIIGHITLSALLLIFSTSWAGQQNKVESSPSFPMSQGRSPSSAPPP